MSCLVILVVYIILVVYERKKCINMLKLLKIQGNYTVGFSFSEISPGYGLLKKGLLQWSLTSAYGLSPRESFNWNCVLNSHSKSSVNTPNLKNQTQYVLPFQELLTL